MRLQYKYSGSCHCGAVQIRVARRPRRLTSCNCSLCRRYATLMAYYPRGAVSIRHARGATEHYSWGDKMIRFRIKGARLGLSGLD